MAELTPEEKKIYESISAALCANHMTMSVADFLADLAIRVARLEKNTDTQSEK